MSKYNMTLLDDFNELSQYKRALKHVNRDSIYRAILNSKKINLFDKLILMEALSPFSLSNMSIYLLTKMVKTIDNKLLKIIEKM